MRFGKSVLAFFVLFVFCLGAADTFGTEMSVRGRATALHVMAPSLGIPDQSYLDTGWLPPQGGDLGATTQNFSVTGIAAGETVDWHSHGDECEGDSHIIYQSGILLPGHAAETSWGSFDGHDDDKCCDEDGDHWDHFTFDGLTFGGMPVTVTGEANQKISIGGVGELTVNEVEWRHDDDCDDDDFTVNALHLVLDNGDEIVVGSVFFESDDHCCPVPTESATWGAIKGLYKMFE